MKYRFIEENKQTNTIELMCDIFTIAVSSYYAWKKHKIGARFASNKHLYDDIHRIFLEHDGRYGLPRIYNQLKTEGRDCSLGRQKTAIYRVSSQQCTPHATPRFASENL